MSTTSTATVALAPRYAYQVDGVVVAQNIPAGQWWLSVINCGTCWHAVTSPLAGDAPGFDVATSEDRGLVVRAARQWAQSANDATMAALDAPRVALNLQPSQIGATS